MMVEQPLLILEGYPESFVGVTLTLTLTVYVEEYRGFGAKTEENPTPMLVLIIPWVNLGQSALMIRWQSNILNILPSGNKACRQHIIYISF